MSPKEQTPVNFEGKPYSTFDVCRILGLERGRLMSWIGNFVTPGTKKPYGKREKTVFSLNEIYSIGLFKYIVDAGWEVNSAKKFVSYVDWDYFKKKNYKYLLICEKKVFEPKKSGSGYDLKRWEGAIPLKSLDELANRYYLKRMGFFIDVSYIINWVDKEI